MTKRPDVNPLTVEEDYFIDAKEPDSDAPPCTTEDIEYFLRNLYRALRIPKEFICSSSYLKDDVE